MAGQLIVRADGSSAIGMGHVMRCLALAQTWQASGGTVTFAQLSPAPASVARLQAEGCTVSVIEGPAGSIADAESTIAMASPGAWIVGDGYLFGSEWQKRIKDAGHRLLLLDDYGHADRYFADLVLNQNGSPHAAAYGNREATTRLLLGNRYVLLRQEFLSTSGAERSLPARASKVLVTLGGGDQDNITARVIAAVAPIPGLDLTVVLGGANPHRAEIRREVERYPNVKLVVDPREMAPTMAGADLALCAAGTTAWELAYLGVPAVYIVAADNQIEVASVLHRHGAGLNLGTWRALSTEAIATAVVDLATNGARRQSMSRAGRSLVDGNGAARVVTRMRAAELKLRPAVAEDERLLWEWANEPAVRESAFNPQPIAWKVHTAWFQRKLQDGQSKIFLGTIFDAEPVGQVRFDRVGADEAEIHVSLARHQRGRGTGAALIRRAVDEYFQQQAGAAVTARIKQGNRKSLRAFEKAGFTRRGEIYAGECPAVEMRIRFDE